MPESKNKISRREFLKLAASAAAAGFLSGCRPAPPTETPPPTETIKEGEVNCTFNWQPLTQEVRARVDENGVIQEILSCSPPTTTEENGETEEKEERSGLPLDESDFTWDPEKLSRVYIDGKTYPVLSSLPLLAPRIPEEINRSTLETIQRIHNDPDFIKRSLARKISTGEVETKPCEPIDVLQVSLDFAKDLYWAPTPGGESCELVENRLTLYDPDLLHNQLVESIKQNSRGNITFNVVEHKRDIREKQLPFTKDPARANEKLIEMYPQVVDYSILAQWAKDAGAKFVFVWGTPNTGMCEYTKWDGIHIFGFNCDRGVNCALESFCHFLENRLLPTEEYRAWSGRYNEYILPYGFDVDTQVEAMKDRIFAAAGYGTVHHPPNALGHYHTDSKLRVLLPGQSEAIDASLWDNDHYQYLNWWISQMPDEFFQILQARI